MVLQTKWEIYFPIVVNCLLSAMMFVFTLRLIPKLVDMFLKANIFGIDVNKKERNKIPEAFGVVIGCMYLITLFIFIPIPFGREIVETSYFPHHEFVKFLAALLSICCMLLLGFADDILDLRWRHKLLLPTVASLPLLMVYYVTFNVTNVIVPKPLRHWFGMSVDLGPLYYLYMGMLAVFCTNAINILAGVNGLEAGQSVVIGISILVFNCIELSGTQWEAHLFSIYLVLPFVATSLALLKYNWYPSKVFVGDTFCYFAGMTFAVVGILGHFSKTMLLFFIPQIFNFVYSTPQLFRIVPCPRHRMPRLNKSGDLEISVASVPKDEIGSLGHLILRIIRLLHVGHVVETEKLYEFSNLTLINLVLVWFGPMKEPTLTSLLLVIQVIGTIIAFCIRYPLASLFYDIVQ